MEMTQSQLLFFFIILTFWVLLAEGIFPFMEDSAVRRDLRIIGWFIFTVLLLSSLATAPSFLLWLQYAAITFVVYIVAHSFNLWAQAPRDFVPDVEVG